MHEGREPILDAATAPIDLEQMVRWARQYDAPVLDLPASEEVSWYPETTTVHESAPPPPSYPGYVVKYGSADADSVELIQRALSSLDYHVAVDRAFGGETDEAVKSFQRDRGLHVDGEVGPDTWEALFAS